MIMPGPFAVMPLPAARKTPMKRKSAVPRDLICLMCPKGCHLTVDVRSDQAVELQGNLCDKGVDFVRAVLDSVDVTTPVPGIAAACSDDELKRIASLWGISLKAVCPRLIPEGSPERTLFRVVFEDVQGDHFVLERIPASAYHAKMRIIQSLAFLSGKGLAQITPYRADIEGQFVRKVDRGLWQLVPFIHGTPLDRGTYLYEGWRAGVLSRFLVELRETSRAIPFFHWRTDSPSGTTSMPSFARSANTPRSSCRGLSGFSRFWRRISWAFATGFPSVSATAIIILSISSGEMGISCL